MLVYLRHSFMKTVFLLRHGQTEDNRKKIIQGQGDSPLTSEGIKSIKKRAAKLKEIIFDAIYCSPLGRAKSSMKILLKELNQNTKIVFSDEIQEIDFGKYTKNNINKMIGIIHEHKKNTSKPYPGGESGDMFKERVLYFMNNFVLNNEGNCFLVITHFGVIETILRHYNNLSYEDICSNKDSIIRLSFNENNVELMFL